MLMSIDLAQSLPFLFRAHSSYLSHCVLVQQYELGHLWNFTSSFFLLNVKGGDIVKMKETNVIL